MKVLFKHMFANLHWVITILLIVYVFVAFLSPILFEIGATRYGWWIQTVYRFLCHQRAERSLFLFGEQFAYTKEELAHYGYGQYLLGYPFVGNEILGYKVAFCIRDIAIYTAMSLSGLYASLTKMTIRIHWKYAVLAIIPMALDGGIQFVSEFLYLSQETLGQSIAEPFYLSTNITRAITGAIFGLGIGLFIFSELKESVRNET